ncbi:putative transcription factor/ chromatin remodeling BED-type(Zn) family [Rosa chinensis]|uniref:Putative transcription factor/ chromatin remodeling BED-type(Zn) family n=1 Tax=Rosa chinensis TaxID=74649 RepID=A0A2P6RHH1_ROSCH|nr:putative transcription factor/ chromatin remodeling BED-type(Zn) family [Rosa chinensis]
MASGPSTDTSMASGGATNAIIPASDTSQSNPASSTALPPVDPKSKLKRKKAEKAGKFRSEVWLHFERIEKPVFETVDGKMQQVRTITCAQCKYCSTDLACDSYENGTSSLRRHIQDVCKKYPGRADIEKGQTLLGSDGSVGVGGESSLAVKLWSQDRCRVAVVEMIVMDELPFSVIERKGFRHFCSVAVPKWEIPSRRTIVKLFLKMYDAKKLELRKELKQHSVCLTTDTWTSVQNINYMVLTAHFIDYGWRMHKRILNFCVISNHSGNSIGKLIETCLIQWGIERVLIISVDNAVANKHAIDYVRKKMVNWSRQPVLGGKFLHVRCLAHILNLIVRSGLTMLDRSVSSIRNAVKFVRSSASRLELFRKCVEKEKLESKKICVLDVPTRWNSTFIMLETSIELKKAFSRMADEEDSKYNSYFDEPNLRTMMGKRMVL